jgi:hypothetical protein
LLAVEIIGAAKQTVEKTTRNVSESFILGNSSVAIARASSNLTGPQEAIDVQQSLTPLSSQYGCVPHRSQKRVREQGYITHQS